MKETMCVYITNRTPARPAQAAWMGRVVGARGTPGAGQGRSPSTVPPASPPPGARGCSPNAAACAVAPPLCACFLPRPPSGGGAYPLFRPVTPSHLSVQTSCPRRSSPAALRGGRAGPSSKATYGKRAMRGAARGCGPSAKRRPGAGSFPSFLTAGTLHAARDQRHAWNVIF